MKKEKSLTEEIIKCPRCGRTICKQIRSKISKRIEVPYFYGGFRSKVELNIPRITVSCKCPKCREETEFSFLIPNLYGIILPFKGVCKEVVNRKKITILGKKDRTMRRIYLKFRKALDKGF